MAKDKTTPSTPANTDAKPEKTGSAIALRNVDDVTKRQIKAQSSARGWTATEYVAHLVALHGDLRTIVVNESTGHELLRKQLSAHNMEPQII